MFFFLNKNIMEFFETKGEESWVRRIHNINHEKYLILICNKYDKG